MLLSTRRRSDIPRQCGIDTVLSHVKSAFENRFASPARLTNSRPTCDTVFPAVGDTDRTTSSLPSASNSRVRLKVSGDAEYEETVSPGNALATTRKCSGAPVGLWPTFR